MELDGFGEPPEIDTRAVDDRVDEIRIALGRAAPQRVVDEIQHALHPQQVRASEDHAAYCAGSRGKSTLDERAYRRRSRRNTPVTWLTDGRVGTGLGLPHPTVGFRDRSVF